VNLQAIQSRFPWVMKPMDMVTTLVTPGRWTYVVDDVASRLSDASDIDTTRLGHVLMRVTNVLSPVRSALLSRSETLRELDWQARRWFWAVTWVSTAAFTRYPRPVSIPRDEEPIRLLSAPETYPDFRAPSLVVPSDVPYAEKSLITDFFVQVLQLLQDVYPIVASHQPIAASDPIERLEYAYTWLYRAVRTPPRWHPDLVEASKSHNLLAALATGGPFAKLLERAAPESNEYGIDLLYLDTYDVKPGLCRLGCKIHFVEAEGDLTVSGIERDGRTIAPGEAGWEMAERVAIAGLMTHLTVWRQGMEYHVGGLAPVPVVTHNIPAAHPIRRLLAPHMSQTMLTNTSTHLTLRRSGWDVLALSFPYDTLMRYYDDGARAFDIRRLDIRADAKRRKIPETLNYPWLPQAERYWDVIEGYVRAYIEHHYRNESDLQADAVAHEWFETLDRTIRGGIRVYVSTLTKENLIRLCTLIIYSVSVAHSENSLWDYAPFMPPMVRADGVGPSVGDVQLTLDFQMIICSPTSLLLHDVSHLALDRDAAAIMRDFQTNLLRLQRDIAGQPDRWWRLLPREVQASVSA
jgi:hypothetical protein